MGGFTFANVQSKFRKILLGVATNHSVQVQLLDARAALPSCERGRPRRALHHDVARTAWNSWQDYAGYVGYVGTAILGRVRVLPNPRGPMLWAADALPSVCPARTALRILWHFDGPSRTLRRRKAGKRQREMMLRIARAVDENDEL